MCSNKRCVATEKKLEQELEWALEERKAKLLEEQDKSLVKSTKLVLRKLWTWGK